MKRTFGANFALAEAAASAVSPQCHVKPGAGGGAAQTELFQTQAWQIPAILLGFLSLEHLTRNHTLAVGRPEWPLSIPKREPPTYRFALGSGTPAKPLARITQERL